MTEQEIFAVLRRHLLDVLPDLDEGRIRLDRSMKDLDRNFGSSPNRPATANASEKRFASTSAWISGAARFMSVGFLAAIWETFLMPWLLSPACISSTAMLRLTEGGALPLASALCSALSASARRLAPI